MDTQKSKAAQSSPVEQGSSSSVKKALESYKNSQGPVYTGLVLLGIVFGIVITASITAFNLTLPAAADNNEGQDFIDAQEQCSNQEGEWTLTDRGYICNQKTRDNGTTCSANDQCSGWCLADTDAVLNQTTEGTCSDSTIVQGCFKYMDNGKVNSICLN